MGKSTGKFEETPKQKPQAKTLAPIEEGSYRRHADEEARISNLASDKVNLNQGNCFTPDCPHQYL